MQEITEEIENQSEKIPFEVIPSGIEYSNINSFKFDSVAGRNILVKLKKGTRSYGGFILGSNYKNVLRVPDFPEEIKIMSEGSILSLSGEKKLSIYSLGIDELNVEVNRIMYKFNTYETKLSR